MNNSLQPLLHVNVEAIQLQFMVLQDQDGMLKLGDQDGNEQAAVKLHFSPGLSECEAELRHEIRNSLNRICVIVYLYNRLFEERRLLEAQEALVELSQAADQLQHGAKVA